MPAFLNSNCIQIMLLPVLVMAGLLMGCFTSASLAQEVTLYPEEQTVMLPAVDVSDIGDFASQNTLQVTLQQHASKNSVYIDLNDAVQQQILLNQTEYYYRDRQVPERLTEALSVHWGNFLVALVEQNPQEALQHIEHWQLDWQRLDATPEEKAQAQRLMVQQLSQLGLYSIAHHISRLPCSLGLCPKLSGWALEQSDLLNWPPEALNEYLHDLGHTLAIFTDESARRDVIEQETRYPIRLKDGLRAWESLSLGDVTKAESQFAWVSVQAPEHPIGFLGLGQAYGKNKKWALATKAFETAKRQSSVQMSAYPEALWDRVQFVTGLERTARGESIIASGRSYSGRSEQMMGYGLLGRYPEMLAHIRQYDCLTVGPVTHRLWANDVVQQYGLWPEHIERYTPGNISTPDYRYAAALLQARQAVLTGPTKRAKQWYQQAAQLNPSGLDAQRGLRMLGLEGGQANLQQLGESAWLHRLSDDTMAEAQQIEQQAQQLKTFMERQSHQPSFSWTLEEKQYVGQLLRRVFMDKYVMHQALEDFSRYMQPEVGDDEQSVQQSATLPWFSSVQQSLSSIRRAHQKQSPPSQWRLAHQLILDMLQSDEHYIEQLSINAQASEVMEQGLGTLVSTMQLGESGHLFYYFDQHVLRHLRALPEIERQRFLFEYELPVDVSDIQALVASTEQQKVKAMSATIKSKAQNSATLKEKSGDESSKVGDNTSAEKWESTQKLRAMMGLNPVEP